MIRNFVRFAALAMVISVSAPPVLAQGQTGSTGGTGSVADSSDAVTTIGDGLDADTIFSNVERGGAVGASTTTVGGDQGAAAGQQGTAGGGLGGGLGGGGLGGLGNLFGNLFGTGTAQNSQTPIRTRLRSAVEFTPVSTQQLQARATQRFRSLESKPALQGINVQVDNQTAVLTGVVATQRDRRLSELLIRLEPGIRSVENKVIVDPDSPSDQP